MNFDDDDNDDGDGDGDDDDNEALIGIKEDWSSVTAIRIPSNKPNFVQMCNLQEKRRLLSEEIQFLFCHLITPGPVYI